VLYHPTGFPNDVSDNDTHSVTLFEASVEVTKTGDDVSKVDDNVTYNFRIENTSSDDAPALEIDDTSGVVDDVLGNLTATAKANGCTTLATGANCTFSVEFTIPDDDPDPLVNTVEVLYRPDGFPNEVSDNDTHSVDLLHPDFTVTKSCRPDPVQAGENITYEIVITNTGDCSLDYHVVDAVANITADYYNWAPEAVLEIEVERTVEPGVCDNVTNEVTVTATLAGDILPNVIEKSASSTCEVICGQGCTPGYWKNHPDCWGPTGYSPDPQDDNISSVFPCFDNGVANLGDDSLMDALNYQGGKGVPGAARILLRAAVAALLNASHPDIHYPFLDNEIDGQAVIDAVCALDLNDRSAMLQLAEELDGYNNTPPCPIDAHCFVIINEDG